MDMSGVKLTTLQDRSVVHLGDGIKELLWHSKEKNVDLMSAECWSRLGQKPFKDDSVPEIMVSSKVDSEA